MTASKTVATQNPDSLQRNCEECGQLYQPGISWGKYCSDKCRWEAWKGDHIRVRKSLIDATLGRGSLKKLEAAIKEFDNQKASR